MKGIKNKRVWFLFVLGIAVAATVCLWQMSSNESKAYTNGRIVERHMEERQVLGAYGTAKQAAHFS